MTYDAIWTTKDGTEIRVSDMETSHLRNAKAFVLRQADALEHAAWSAFDYAWSAPDGAAIAAELEADAALEVARSARHWAEVFSRELDARSEGVTE